MTRFVGEAKDVRQGRVRRFPTGKEMKKEMEVFKRTGRHPALEGNNADSLPALPERDMNRRHVFLDIRQGTDDLGVFLGRKRSCMLLCAALHWHASSLKPRVTGRPSGD